MDKEIQVIFDPTPPIHSRAFVHQLSDHSVKFNFRNVDDFVETLFHNHKMFKLNNVFSLLGVDITDDRYPIKIWALNRLVLCKSLTNIPEEIIPHIPGEVMGQVEEYLFQNL